MVPGDAGEVRTSVCSAQTTICERRLYEACGDNPAVELETAYHRQNAAFTQVSLTTN
jgi:hypothetical protein